MKTSIRGLIEIASHEGICLRPYRDSVGVLTFGIGHTRAAGNPDPFDLPPFMDQPLSMVFEVFRRDIAKYEADVTRLVKVPVAQHKFDALVSFHYNTGGLARAKLLQSLNRGDYAGAAEGFMGWLKPPEIIGRRRKEQALFRDGRYSSNGRVMVYPVDPRSQKPVFGQGRSIDALAALSAGKPVGPIPAPPAVPQRPTPKPPPASPAGPPAGMGRWLEWLRAAFGRFFFDLFK